MKTKPAKSPDAITLRKLAEAKLSVKKKKGAVVSQPSKDLKHLVHELEVHQIELEIQNEELKQTRAELETALDQFTDLYDFAPVGYFTLSRDGVIQRTNLAGTTLLGVERFRLVQKRLVAFVPAESYVAFNTFLQNVFSTLDKETCEIPLLNSSRQKIWVQLEGLRIEKSETCRIAAMDITKRKLAEAEQAKLASIVNSSEDAIVGKTLDGIITSWNAGAQKLYGYTGQEVVGQSVAILVPKDRQDELLGILAQIRRGESVEHYETVRVRKDGVRLDVSVTVSPIFDEAGRVAAASSISRDVTRRKQAEQKLHESEARYRAISESANDAIISADEAGNIVDWNPGAERMFGYTEAEAYGQPLSLILPDRYRDVHRTAMERVQTGVEKHIIGKTIEIEGRRKDDSEFPLENSVSEWQVGDKKYYSAIIRDITTRKEAEKKLAATQAMYQLLAENSWDSVSLINAEGKIEYASPSYTRRLGYAENEMLDLDTQGILERLHPDDRNYVAMEVKRGRALKLPSTRYEYRARTKSGEYVWFEDVVHREFDDHGQFVRTIINSRDISERKQADEMIAQYANELEARVEERTAELVFASQAKDDFLANMSHELRTPLNSILGFSESLLEGVRGPLNDRQKEALEYVNSSGQHLLGLINDILDLSKVEANKLEIQPEVVAINEVCMSSLVFIRQIALKKNIKVEYIRQPEAETIIADPKRLKQILVNLLSNAAKFTPERGYIKLEVKTDAANKIMQFSVSDTGIGISEENLQKLFKPFVQLESSLSRHYEGTGLGLVLVKRIAEMHGGSIHTESEEGQGSCFTVTLPWSVQQQQGKPDSRSMETSSQKKDNTGQQYTAGARILLADDNEISLELFHDYLEHCGYAVFIARDGEEVLSQVEEINPDLILMDIQMPKISGVEATRRLRANPKFASIPIVALTALTMPGDRERLIDAGVTDYISKPVSLPNLPKMIEDILRQPS